MKEHTLLKEEHKGNVKELNSKIDEMEAMLRFKTERINEVGRQMQAKDQEMQKMRLDTERLMKNLKDTSL